MSVKPTSKPCKHVYVADRFHLITHIFTLHILGLGEIISNRPSHRLRLLRQVDFWGSTTSSFQQE